MTLRIATWEAHRLTRRPPQLLKAVGGLERFQVSLHHNNHKAEVQANMPTLSMKFEILILPLSRQRIRNLIQGVDGRGQPSLVQQHRRRIHRNTM
jgi:hypothetical protein